MKICITNFQLGSRKIDVMGIDEKGDIYLVFLSTKEADSSSLSKLLIELSDYLWEIDPFFEAFQKDLVLKIFLVTPTKTYNLREEYFKPQLYEKTEGHFLRENVDIKKIEPSILVLPSPANYVKKPSLKFNKLLSHNSLHNFIIDNMHYIYTEIFSESLQGKQVLSEYLIESELGNWPADIVIKHAGEIVNILEIESPLPKDLFLHDKRKNSLKRELKIYNSKIEKKNIAVITQKNESEIENICQSLGILYLPLSRLDVD
jgi:hypothetical protein